MSKLISKLKSILINNENKNRIINLELLKSHVKSIDFTLLDAGCGVGLNLIDIIINYPKAKMGNIYKKNIRSVTKSIICPFNICACGPDIKISKETLND